jgi:hypothetical protein
VWGVQAEGEGSVVHSAALGQLREAVAQAAEWEAQLRRALAKKGTSTDVDGPALLQKVNAPRMRRTGPGNMALAGLDCACSESAAPARMLSVARRVAVFRWRGRCRRQWASCGGMRAGAASSAHASRCSGRRAT